MASSSLECHFCVKSHICSRKKKKQDGGGDLVNCVALLDSVESAETSKSRWRILGGSS